MPWIINAANNPVFVGLGSPEMTEAKNCYSAKEEEAQAAQVESCKHETKIGFRATGHIQCADCGKPFYSN